MLSEKEAYKAMFLFLEKHYRMTGADEIGALLGAMSLNENGDPIDIALWHDWINAIDEIKTVEGTHFKLKIDTHS